MNFPKLDLGALPGLDSAQGLFGSIAGGAGATYDDSIVVLMVYIHDTIPPESFV